MISVLGPRLINSVSGKLDFTEVFRSEKCVLVQVIIRFEFNLELICTSEVFKKLKLHEPL